MRSRAFLLAIVLAAAASVACAATPPSADTFKAYDCPGDDGTAILVTWSCPPEDNAVATYSLEIAKSEADFASGDFVSIPVALSRGRRATARPQYFGHSEANTMTCFLEVTIPRIFPLPERGAMTSERLKAFAADNVIDEAAATRAISVLEHANTPDNGLLPGQLSDRHWFKRLEEYLEKEDSETDEKLRQETNAATYYFRLAVVDGDAKTYVAREGKPMVLSAAAVPNLFNTARINTLVFSLTFSAVVVAFIYAAKRRAGLFIRRIAGLDAIDEAIGRATEMDRPVFFVHGLGGLGGMATMASLNVLSEAARRTAEHDTRIRVMNCDALVTAVSLEVVQQSYTSAGRPDAFNPDDVSLVASEQFAYVAAVSGNMVREKPGANFFMGSFFAESLLLAETGASTGAIQVAGTDSYTQIPFFITTCDYTLIGEELYAASAYLSRDSRVLGSIRGQDVGKAFLMVVIVVVSVTMTVALWQKWELSWLQDLFKAVQ